MCDGERDKEGAEQRAWGRAEGGMKVISYLLWVDRAEKDREREDTG